MTSIALDVVNAAALHSTSCLTTAKGSHSNEGELVSCVKAGDQVAFRELIERYEARIFRVIWGILGNRDDAEEIAQEVFAKVYFSIRTFDGRSTLYTWIYRIAVNECYGFLRKQRLKLVAEGDVADDRFTNAADMHPLADRTTIERDFVNKLLANVDEDDRMLLLWKEVEGLSLEELVELTGLNKNTIKVRLYRTRSAPHAGSTPIAVSERPHMRLHVTRIALIPALWLIQLRGRTAVPASPGEPCC